VTLGAVLVIAAIASDRRGDDVTVVAAVLGVAGVVLVPAVGWAAVAPAASLVALAVAVGLGGFAAVAFRRAPLQAGAAIVGAGAFLAGAAVVLTERGVAAAPLGAMVAGLAAGMLVVARTVRAPAAHPWVPVALEAVACTGAVVGALAAGSEPTARLVADALVTLAFVAAATRPDDRAAAYATTAVIAAVLTGAAGLAPGTIPAEWITLPAATIALLIALAPASAGRDSGRRFGPALAMGAITSVGLAVTDGGWRVVVVVGAASLVVLAVDLGAPYAAAIPRWLLIGSAGAFALWAGATADRRLAQLRHWRDAVDRFA
jgi:hypothetical protein